MTPQDKVRFSNLILGEWDAVMDRFFTHVDKQRAAEGLTDAEVYQVLSDGYGDTVAEAWEEWSNHD